MYDCFNGYVEDCDIIDRVTQRSSVKCDNSDSVNGGVNMVNVNVQDVFLNGIIDYVNDKCSDKSNVSNKTTANSAVYQSHKSIVDYTDYVQLKDGAISPDVLSKGIKFGHRNMWSLIGKIDVFKHMCNNVFDVICVNETLCDSSIPDTELHLPGYNILREDRNRAGGGVALYINDMFNYSLA